MQFGVQFFPDVRPEEKAARHYFSECLDIAEEAERLGFTHARIVEHYFHYYGGYSPTTTDYTKVLLGFGDAQFSLPITSTLRSYPERESGPNAAALGDVGASMPTGVFRSAASPLPASRDSLAASQLTMQDAERGRN